jgi:hypothetical protein
MEAYCNNGSLDHSQAQSDFLDRLKDTQTPIDRKIIELKEAGTKISAVPDTPPDKDEAEIRPPALNLDPLKLGTSGLPFLDDVTLCGWLSSNDILPCLKQSALELSEDVQLRVELEALLATEASQSRETIDFLAHNAPRYFQVIHGVSNLDHPQPTAALFLIKHVRRIKRCTTAHFMHFLLSSRYPRLDEIFYMLSAGAIVTMYKDLYVNQSASFFGRLFDSDLAEPMVIQARQAWDNLLIFSGNESGADTRPCVPCSWNRDDPRPAGRGDIAIREAPEHLCQSYAQEPRTHDDHSAGDRPHTAARTEVFRRIGWISSSQETRTAGM